MSLLRGRSGTEVGEVGLLGDSVPVGAAVRRVGANVGAEVGAEVGELEEGADVGAFVLKHSIA